jgi:galactose mutarotase-like enzyme
MNREILQWSSGNIKIEVCNVGAELQSVCVGGGDNLLWSKNEEFWNRVAPNLFPIVGRLKDDKYRFMDRDFFMKQHGFARDCAFEVVEKNVDTLRLRLRWNDGSMSSYPFEFQYDVIYSVQNDFLWVDYEITNFGKQPMLYSVGGHPGFAIDGALENYELRFEENFVAERWLIEGAYYSGEKELMAVNGSLALVDGLFDRDAIVFKEPPFNRVSLYKKGGRKLLDFVCSEWDAVGFWTKPGAPFFCIEPWWGWADGWNDSGELMEKSGMHTLLPGTMGSHRYGFGIMD